MMTQQELDDATTTVALYRANGQFDFRGELLKVAQTLLGEVIHLREHASTLVDIAGTAKLKKDAAATVAAIADEVADATGDAK